MKIHFLVRRSQYDQKVAMNRVVRWSVVCSQHGFEATCWSSPASPWTRLNRNFGLVTFRGWIEKSLENVFFIWRINAVGLHLRVIHKRQKIVTVQVMNLLLQFNIIKQKQLNSMCQNKTYRSVCVTESCGLLFLV
jgi:hypothetical protein